MRDKQKQTPQDVCGEASVWFESLPNILCLFVFSVPPLFVIEFLHRVVDTFTEYFSSCTETSIKDNVVIVFEVRKKGKESCQIFIRSVDAIGQICIWLN